MMTARELLNINNDINITNISNDSREINENGLYFAIEGLTVDGHDFIDNAIENGAVVIVHSKQVKKNENILYYQVDDILDAYNTIASKFWGQPTANLKVIGTTGTNGKSTTSWIIDDILNTKYESGYIGTVGIKTDDELKPSPFTTLLPHQYNQLFAQMVETNKQYAVIEVSSQGLDQKRTDFISFDYAIMTNLTHEHLDYHITMDNYLQAKGRLFTQLKNEGLAIINNDDELSAEYLSNVATGKVVTYGINNQSDVMAINIRLGDEKSQFTLVYFDQQFEIETNLVGEFNIYNLLAALIVVIDSGVDIEIIIEKCKNISQVSGRMETIENDKGIHVIVDYAHTPDGFTQFYKYIDTIKKGKVISVFGSAGERDFVKRPVLGQISDNYSDYIILTEEDCNSEDPSQIASEIANGIKEAKHEYVEDREQAIMRAFELAKENDIICILAKGNEQFQKKIDGKHFYKGDVTIAQEQVEKYSPKK